MPIHEIRPMIPIADLERSLDFYVRGLGLKLLDKNTEWGFAMLEGEDCRIMLDQSIRKEGSANAVVYLYTDTLGALRECLCAAGYHPDPINDTFYGMTEFRVRDPDKNWIWVGASERAKDG